MTSRRPLSAVTCLVALLAGAALLCGCQREQAAARVFAEPARIDVEGNGKDIPPFQLYLAVKEGARPDALVQPTTTAFSKALKACAEADDRQAHVVRAEVSLAPGARSATVEPMDQTPHARCIADKAKALLGEQPDNTELVAARFELRLATRKSPDAP